MCRKRFPSPLSTFTIVLLTFFCFADELEATGVESPKAAQFIPEQLLPWRLRAGARFAGHGGFKVLNGTFSRLRQVSSTGVSRTSLPGSTWGCLADINQAWDR